jgi:hypothetical protein
MKIKIFVAFFATVTIIFLSCNWFRSRKREVSNPLVGEWKLDSVGIKTDTSRGNILFIAAVQDSNGVNISFTEDSLFVNSKDGIDTTAYSFDLNTNQLTMGDSKPVTMSFSKLNDSVVSLTTKDSATLYLLKK